MAKEVANIIEAPLDLVITRKIGAPDNPELAVGAVSQDGEMITSRELVHMLGIPDDYLRGESARQMEEIRSRMKKYRGDRPYPQLKGKTVVILDDGIATGSTIQAAAEFVRKKNAAHIILAAPVGPPDTVRELSKTVDRVVCLGTPAAFNAIGEFYEEFEQVEDDTVRKILSAALP